MKKIKIVEPDKWINFVKNEAQYHIPSECRGGIVIDCGCNIGDFEMNHQDKFDKFICYDVLEENIDLLNKNLKDKTINYIVEKRACHPTRDIMVPIYAHQMNGGLNYFGNSGNVSTTLLSQFPNGGGNGWFEENKIDEARSITIEEIVETYGKIKLLKFDIEGGEYEFLTDKDLTNFEYIVGELHFGEDKILPLVDYITKTHDIISGSGHIYSFKIK